MFYLSDSLADLGHGMFLCFAKILCEVKKPIYSTGWNFGEA